MPKPTKAFTYPIVITCLSLASIVSLIYFNVTGGRKPVAVEANSINGTLKDGLRYDDFHHQNKPLTDLDSSSTAIAFLNDFDKDLIQNCFEPYAAIADQKILVLFPYTKMVDIAQKVAADFPHSPIEFGHDDENSTLLKSFGYPEFPKAAYVLYDRNHTVLDITDDWTHIQNLSRSHAAYGNKEGDILPEASLYRYCKEDTFSFRTDSLGRLTYLNFWGTWCGPCVQEMPHFAEFKKAHPDVEVVAVHSPLTSTAEEEIRKDMTAIETFIETKENSDGILWKDFGIDFLQDDQSTSFYTILFGNSSIYPMTVVIDSDGVIDTIYSGSITYQMLENNYQKLIKE